MAVMQSRDTRTFEAGGDLSAGQFKFVALAADGQVDLAGDGAQAIGVLYNQPDAAGKAATVVMTGKVIVEAGDSVTAGDAIGVDADGNAVTAATSDITMGYALEDAVDGQIFAIELIQGGNAAA
jgi:lipopolysaccharide export system protein LptA